MTKAPADDRQIGKLPLAREEAFDADVWRDMIGFTAHRLMEIEVGLLTRAMHCEKSTARLVQRNGYDQRLGDAAVTGEFRIPRLRKGS